MCQRRLRSRDLQLHKPRPKRVTSFVVEAGRKHEVPYGIDWCLISLRHPAVGSRSHVRRFCVSADTVREAANKTTASSAQSRGITYIAL